MEKKINTDASHEDVSKVYARETAYNDDLAKNYDAFRFTKKSGLAIHAAEKNWSAPILMETFYH